MFGTRSWQQHPPFKITMCWDVPKRCVPTTTVAQHEFDFLIRPAEGHCSHPQTGNSPVTKQSALPEPMACGLRGEAAAIGQLSK